ncbi:LpxI family protein [Chlamydiota bacterium]
MKKIGIIAGNNSLPILLSQEAKQSGVEEIYVVGFNDITVPEIKRHVTRVTFISVGQFGSLLQFFKKNAVEHIFMIGQIPPRLIFKKIKFDLRGMNLFRKVYKKGAVEVFGVIAKELEKEGLQLLDSTFYLQNHLARKGILTKKAPTKKIIRDIHRGTEIAKHLTQLDIGQTVVVKDGAVLALEAFEGTDETIIRGAQLGGDGVIVVKVSSSKQDMRFDVPVIGPKTIEVLRDVKAKALSIDAGKTLLIDKQYSLNEANKSGLVIVAS